MFVGGRPKGDSVMKALGGVRGQSRMGEHPHCKEDPALDNMMGQSFNVILLPFHGDGLPHLMGLIRRRDHTRHK